eukprot:3032321-Alexandrium_andersonii.AAC.1
MNRRTINTTLKLHTLVPPEEAYGKKNVFLKRAALSDAVKADITPAKAKGRGKGKRKSEEAQVSAEWKSAKHLLR